MFFPIGDTNVKGGYKIWVTYLILILNIAVFLFQFSLSRETGQALIAQFGCTPRDLMQGQHVYTLFTSMFLHGGWMHVIGNMLFLWVFADNIEATIGPWRFLIFYMAGGVLATAAHVYMNPLSDVPCVGASGAIAACLGAYLFLFPGSRVRVLFLLFFTTFEVPALLFLGIWIVQQFLAGVGSLGALTTDTSGVAYWSHIGGFGFGLLSALWIRSRSAFRRMEEED